MSRIASATYISSALLVLVLTGCGPKQEGATQPAGTLPTARVRTQTVEIKPRTVTEEVVGTITPKFHATLEAKLSGRILAMPIVLGQKVQKGQLIARLDAPEIAARLEQTLASLEQAERDWKRVSALFEQQSVTRAEYDSAQTRLRAAQAAVAEAKAMMSYVEITAPFEAVVTRKSMDVGDLAAPGKPLADIEDPTALQMEADVPEAIAARINRDSRLDIFTDAQGGSSNQPTPVIQGIVSEIAPSADPLSRTFRVKLDLPPGNRIMSGQFARLLVPLGEQTSVRIAASAVVQRGQLEIVFAMADQHARLHLVKTGRRIGDEIEILSGLDGVKTVVVSGADSLSDGQPVEVE